MTEQDHAKDFLLSVREARAEAHRLRAKVLRLETQAEKVTASLSGMPGGGGDAQRLWSALSDLRAFYVDKLIECEQSELEVSAFIDRIPNDLHRLILRYRYLELNVWERVQSRLEESGIYYEIRQIYRHHGEALQAARALWASEHDDEYLCKGENE